MNPPTPSVNDTKKKTVKAWAIIGKKDRKVHAVAMNKRLLLGNKDFPVIPCTITYSI